MCGIFPIQVLQGEAFDSAVVKKKSSSIPCPDGRDLKVLLSPQNQHRQSTVSGPARYLNGRVGSCNCSDIIYTVDPTSVCTIHVTGNPSWNSDDL